MTELEPRASLSQKVPLTFVPWWVRISRVLWRIVAYLGTTIVLGAVASLIATWLVSPQGAISVNAPLRQIFVYWPIALPLGCCLLLLAFLIWKMSQWHPQQALSPSQQNRMRMLRRLRHTYLDLLTQSLQGAAWLELGLRPEARRSSQCEQIASAIAEAI